MELIGTVALLRELGDPEVLELDMRRWWVEERIRAAGGRRPRVHWHTRGGAVLMDMVAWHRGQHHFWAWGRAPDQGGAAGP